MNHYQKNQTVEVSFLISEIEQKIKQADEMEKQAWKAEATGIAYRQIGIKEGLQTALLLIHKYKR